MVPFLENKKHWGFPYLKIENTKFPFRVFDRYEIHIRAFVDFITGNLSFPDPHLHLLFLFLNMDLCFTKNLKTNNNMVHRTYNVRKKSPRLSKIIFVQDESIFSCIRCSMLVIIRSTGPDFDQIFEVPQIL